MACTPCSISTDCGRDPCTSPAPVSADNESLSSALDNFILNFYGTVTKTVVDGAVVWTLPCNLAEGIPGYPRDPALGTACYFRELFIDFDARITANSIAIASIQTTVDGLGSMSQQDADAVAITGGTISGMPAPTLASDVATKQYVDSVGSGITPRVEVQAATVSNIVLAPAPASVDGVTLTSGDRVLVKNQTLPEDNGVYSFDGVNLVRAADSNTASELAQGFYYFVQGGTVNQYFGWFISTAPTVLGTDPIEFSQFSAAFAYLAGDGLSLTGQTFAVDSSVVRTTGNQSIAGTKAFTGIITAADEVRIGGGADMGAYLLQVTGGTRLAGTLDVTGNAQFTNLLLKGNQVNEFLTNGVADVALNYDGYLGGTTQFRNTVIYDGKNAVVATFTGSTKALTVVGGIVGALTGNASTATALQTARTIGGSGFDGTSNVTSFPSPGPIGGGVPSTGAFTTLASGAATLSGKLLLNYANPLVQLYDSAATANSRRFDFQATGGALLGRVVNDADSVATTWLAVQRTGTVLDAITFTAPNVYINGALNATSDANVRSSKANFNVTLNVKDYGASGNGSTDDLAAIQAACDDMTDHSVLYFPPGNYRVTGGIYSFAGLTDIALVGEGATITNDSGASGANTFVFEHTCSHVRVSDLRFVGTATTRGSGIHLRVYCSDVRISGCYFTKCSDFAVHISNDTGDTTASSHVVIDRNTFHDTLGDGVHVSSATDVVISNNVFSYTGDDAIGIVRDSLTASGVPTRVVIIGNTITRAGYGTAAVSGMGIRIAEANDVLVDGNVIDYTYQAPIVVERYLSTSVFNYRIKITNNKVLNGNQLAGQLGSIGASFCQGVTISDNKIDDAANGGGIAFLDCNDLVIQGNQIRNVPSRGIGSDDGTTTNVAANCYRVWILGNSLLYTLANQAIYAVAPPGKTINDLVISGNVAGAVPAGDYIYYDRVTNGKIVNNTQLASNTIGAGGTVSGVTAANNN